MQLHASLHMVHLCFGKELSKKMKKIIFFVLMIITLYLNLSFFWYVNNDFAENFIHRSEREILQIMMDSEETGLGVDDLIPHLEQFSYEKNISIAVIATMGGWETRYINMYMTNIENHPQIQLIEGVFPTGIYHISNRRNHENNFRQSGQISFPTTDFDIRIYEMDQVRNVGFLGGFHLIGATEYIANEFSEIFSIYGAVTEAHEGYLAFVQDGFLDFHNTYSFYQTGNVFFIDAPEVIMLAFLMFTLFLMIAFFLIGERRKLLISHLWGHHWWNGLLMTLKKFIKFYLSYSLVFAVLFITVLIVLNQNILFFQHILNFILTQMMLFSVFVSFLGLGLLLMQKFNNVSLGLKGKSFFERLHFITFGIKVFVSVSVLFMTSVFLANILFLREEVNEISYWHQANHVYRLEYSGFGPMVELKTENIVYEFEGEMFEIEQIITTDEHTLSEMIRTEKFRHLFRLLAENKNGFVLNNWAFTREIDLEGDVNNWTFLDSSWVHPEQGSLQMSEHYFYLNPIYDVSGINILDLLIDESHVLNVLVPEHFENETEQLHEHYLEFFYLNSIWDDNWNRERLGIPLLDLRKKDLIINFIFTASGQYYFLFDRNRGDEHNRILDPFAVVFTTSSMETINLNFLIQSQTFFINEEDFPAFESIRPFVEESGAFGFQSVFSTELYGNERLIHLQWLLMEQFFQFLVMTIFLFLVIVVLIWSYYIAHTYQLNLYYLFGYSDWERHRELIISSLLPNALAVIILTFFNGFSLTIIVGALMISFLEIVVIRIIGKRLTKNHVSKVLKGGEL